MPITLATARIAPLIASPASAVPAAGAAAATGLDRLKARLPEHAHDLRINLGVIAGVAALSPEQAWGAAVTAAITARNPEVVAAIEETAAQQLSPEALSAARGAASIMAMNNVYFRFLHVMGDDTDYAQMPMRLRMQLIAKPGVDALDFALWCLAASSITGCERCVRLHEASVHSCGGSVEHVHETVRIAAVVHGVALTLATASHGETIAQ
jgi:alkyl hydroperoxide reductase subunit D